VASPSWVPLTGADCFLRAFDDEIRRKGAASHLSQCVLSVGPGFSVEAFSKLVLEVSLAHPILRAPVRRRGGIGLPSYALHSASRAPLPRVEVHDVATRGAGALPPPELIARLNERRSLRRGELLCFDVVCYAGGSQGFDVVATWAHMLFDGAGSERFLVWLDEVYRQVRGVSELPAPDELAPPPPHELGAGERGRRAREWQHWMDGLGHHPVRSLSGPLSRQPQDLRYELLSLAAEDTEQVCARAADHAGFLTPMLFYLAAAIRAHHAVYCARKVDPGSYVVPLPVNLRPKGREGAIFRTHTSLLWFQALPESVGDLEGLIEVLKVQRRDAIRAGHIQNGAYAMEFTRMAPRRLYARMARAALRGELCSFFFAYTGEFAEGLEHFVGGETLNAHHVAPVPASPGSCLAVNLFRGRLNATHVFQRGVFSAEEREIFDAQLRADLLGAASTLP
jgi:hypothetical protein